MGAAGIVLAGGRSSRMGSPKAALDWHGTSLLRRTVGITARGADGAVVVVRAPGQALPELPSDVRIVDDDQEGLGPLQGIAIGLAAASEDADVAFVCSTDLPFLHPAYIQRVLALVEKDVDVAVPVVHGYRQPLAAAYRTNLATTVADLLATGARKPAMLFDLCRTRWLDEADLLADPTLARLDPDLTSVRNINDPEEYAAARDQPQPLVSVERFGALARNGHRGVVTVTAGTLAAAASAVEIVLDRHVVAAVNGERITRDEHLPLATGDRIAFLSADAGG